MLGSLQGLNADQPTEFIPKWTEKFMESGQLEAVLRGLPNPAHYILFFRHKISLLGYYPSFVFLPVVTVNWAPAALEIQQKHATHSCFVLCSELCF